MKKPDFKRILTTKGDLAFPAAGLDLWTIKVSGRKTRKIYNGALKPGQPVLWKIPTTLGAVPQTVAYASLTAADLPYLRVGVAHSSAKNGIVDSIRSISMDDLGACQIQEIGAYGPTCGLSQIEAIYPKCLTCDGLTLAIEIEDMETRGFHGSRGFETIYANYTPQCKDCDSCDREPTCDEFMCGLVDAINGKLETALIDGLPYPGVRAKDMPKKIRAVKLYDTFKAYCFTPTDGTCTDCDRIDDLTTFTVNDTEYTFTGVTDPADNTKTLTSQLAEAARQIEEAFVTEFGQGQHAGFAVLTENLGNCCGIQLYVSTCDESFAITGVSECPGAITQFPTFNYSPVCKDCSSSDTTYTPNCGIAIISEGYSLDCDCFPLIDFPDLPLRQIRVQVLDQDVEISSNYETATLQKPQIPSNYGAQVQAREYNQTVGGEGFNFDQGNTYDGRLGLPDPSSQLRNMVTADCAISYCSYYLQTIITREQGQRGTKTITRNLHGEINVPQGDSTTKTAVEGFLAKLASINPQVCSDVSAATCE